ncbi:MAG: adenosylcobinamide-GDP ribazoletransferase [Pseudomonadota bacterium]
MPLPRSLAETRRNLQLAFGLLTRLPVGRIAAAPSGAELGRATRVYPLVGALVGLIGGAVLWLAVALGVPDSIAAFLALGATVLVTGAFHEDGLADTADGLGGGANRARKLEIMQDSRIGSYGVLALIFSLALRGFALAYLAAFAAPLAGLVAAHALSRAWLPGAMMALAPARTDGLAARLDRPGPGEAGFALALGLVIAFAVLGLVPMLWLLAVAVVVTTFWLWLIKRQLGGTTGDTLGALQQILEASLLITLVVLA